MNFQWLIDQCQRDQRRVIQLICSDDVNNYYSDDVSDVTEFQVSYIKPSSVQVTLKNDCQLKFAISEASTFIHDYTYDCFYNSKDSIKTKEFISLGDIKKLNNPSNKMTPGQIIETENFIVVVVLKTSRFEIDESSGKSIFKREKYIYTPPLRERAIAVNKNIHLFIIIMTPSSIITNANNMPVDLIHHLISRHRFAIAIGEKLLEELKFNIFEEGKKNDYHRECESIFQAIYINRLPNDTFFTEKVIEHCKNPIDARDYCIARKHMTHAQKLAEEKLHKETHNNNGELDQEFIKNQRLVKLNAKWSQMCNAQKNKVKTITHKCVVQIPYVNLRPLNQDEINNNSIDFTDWTVGKSDNPTHWLIKESINCVKSSSNSTVINSADEHNDDVEIQLAKHNMKYHRVEPSLPMNIAEQLATWGVNKESFENNSEVYKNAVQERSTPYSLLTNTDDINKWITSVDHFQLLPHKYFDNEYSRDSMIKKAIKISSFNTNDVAFSEDVLDRFKSSKIGRWSRIMSDVGDQLSIALHQRAKKNEWLLKKLRYFNMYLLIKPTDQSENLYYTLFWKNSEEIYSRGKDSDDCFVTKNIHTDGFISWVDLSSQNTSKLVNLVEFESQLLCNFVFECENFNLNFMLKEDIFVDETSEKISNARQSLLLSMLVMNNDKIKLDELMSNARFIVMEGFKSHPLVPDPGKMLDKFPTVYRNRLEIWAANRMLETSRKIIENLGYVCDNTSNDEDSFKWTGLFDPFLHIPLANPHQLINAVYYNYCKNKDELAHVSGSSKMMAKILSYEDRLPLTNDYLGSYSPNDLTYYTHEFSPHLVRVMSKGLAEKLENKLGLEWKTIIKGEIFDDLNYLDLETISTLKASAAFTDSGESRGKRPRAVEEIRKIWSRSGKTGWQAIHLLLPALTETYRTQGLRIDLMRKNQHGGLREVYIMSISSRIIQLVLEQISRSLCKHFNSEMLTHSSMRLSTPADHSEKAKKMSKGQNKNITVCTSDDASKWNQGHFVTKFGIMLCQLTDPIFHPFIIRALDLWTKKKIYLPRALINMFENNPNYNSVPGDEYINKIYKCYIGFSSEKWMQPKTNYIQTKSGMMQGILHVTSSLFHTLIQEYMKDQVQVIITKKYFNIDRVVTVMQSSDDSGMMVSLPTDNDEDASNKKLLITSLFYMKHELGKMIGIYPSEKCTVGTINIFEFNSEFFIWGSAVRPTRKWIYAVSSIVECDSLYARQMANYNLISEILEGGGSSITAWFCQISQAMMYYRMLGCSISPLWYEYAEKISKILDPTMGFYYIDNPRYCGLASIRFGLWLLTKNSQILSKKLNHIIHASAEKRQEAKKEGLADFHDIMGVLGASFVTGTSTINTENLEKLKKIVNNLNLNPKWQEQVENRPVVLYRPALNADEYDLKLAVKMHQPGISTSLSRENCVSRMIFSSLNFLSNNISLPIVNDVNEQELDEEGECIIFPLKQEYLQLVNLANEIDLTGTLNSYQNLKKKRFDIVVFKSPIPNDYSLEKLVAWKWFGMKIPLSNSLAEKLFKQYKKNIRWLKDTPKETLLKSPFINQIMMQTYLSSSDLKDRTILINTSVVGARSTLSVILSQNMWPNWRPNCCRPTELIHDNLQLLSHGIYMSTCSGMERKIINNTILNLLKYSKPLLPPTIKIIHSPRSALYLMQRLAQRMTSLHDNDSSINITKTNLRNWIHDCYYYAIGCFGYFVDIKQNANEQSNGEFIWSGRMDKCVIQIHGDSYRTYDACVTKIIVNSSENFHAAWPIFKQWLEDHKVLLDLPRKYNIIKGDKIIARILNNKLTVERLKTAIGIPVVMNTYTNFIELDENWFDISTIFFESDEHKISVQITMKDNKSQTVLSCPIEYLDKSIISLPITAYDFMPNPPVLWKNFVTLKLLSADKIDKLLRIIIANNYQEILTSENNDILPDKIKKLFWDCAESSTLEIDRSIETDEKSDEEYSIDYLLPDYYENKINSCETNLILSCNTQDNMLNVVEATSTWSSTHINVSNLMIKKWLDQLAKKFSSTKMTNETYWPDH
ncbi:uncharacterized protein LOC122854392 [Aphidius gifuensis]|uniref:uncharacterized protein LOC122854392 n=1 Tax=Aphidius gifuensis TaxID=684658 RepID=UPI001CDC41DB|nr:uncharacterized protein LOC122854392 [Aphidius gifuensis]